MVLVGASDKVWWGLGNSFIRGREHLGPTPHVRVMELHAEFGSSETSLTPLRNMIVLPGKRRTAGNLR